MKCRKQDNKDEGKDALPLYNHERIEQIAAQECAKRGINKDEAAVAVTRDGRVYVGTAVPMSKISRLIMRHKYLALLLLWVGKASDFFFIRILRLPYLFDRLRKWKQKKQT